MKVIGVNNKTFSGQRMLDALAESVTSHKIEFLLVEGEDFRTIVLELFRRSALSRAGARQFQARHACRDSQAAGKSSQGQSDGHGKGNRHQSPIRRARTEIIFTPRPRAMFASELRRPSASTGRLGRRSLESRPWTDLFVDIGGQPVRSPSVRDHGQDVVERRVPLYWRTARRAARLGHPDGSTIRSSSTTTTSRSSSTPTATTTSITRSRSTHSIPSGTCCSRSPIATRASQSMNGSSRV